MSGICGYCGKSGVLGKREDGSYERYHAHCLAEINVKRRRRAQQAGEQEQPK